MREDLEAMLERAVQDPRRLGEEVARLDDDGRRALLEKAASGATSRRLYSAFGRLGPTDESALAPEDGVTVYLGRTSLPALGAFELHLFRRRGAPLWGRAVTRPRAFAGPGYFVVDAGKELVLDFDRVPTPKDVPEGWPPVRSNGGGLAAVVFGGTQLRLRGSGSGLLTGPVLRRGRDQGAFVNLVRAKRPSDGSLRR